MKLFNYRSISTKLSILVAVIPLLTGLLLFFNLTRMKNLEQVALTQVEKVMLNGHMVKVQALASSMATALGEALSQIEERKKREAYVRRIVNPIRFFPNKTGYFFVYRRDGTRVALPTAPQLVGINSSSESPRTKKHVADFIEKANKGGGFTQWYWEKPGKKGSFLKQGYVAPIPGTDLLLITAVYIDDVQKERAAAAAAFEHFFKKTSRQNIAVVVVVFLIVLLPFLYFLRSRVIRPIKEVVSASRALAHGDYTVD
ncbi:MAG TPA: HAMP domain-containing protein, partial [Desulfobacteraceae bacterium]|nr:HAMP domain-containing protein [Desulfobacteraceae bacterium]